MLFGPRSLLVLTVFLPASHLWAGREFQPKTGEEVIPNEFLVQMMPGMRPSDVLPAFIPGAIATALQGANLHLIRVPAGIPPGLISNFAGHALVSFVEPNRVRRINLQPPNDPYLGSQWDLTTVQAMQAWGLIPNKYLTAAQAGTSRVKVAILDTGIDCTHPDFMNSGGASADSALGGQILFSSSLAYIATQVPSPACSWQDDYGHGTHVAGTVAAATQNAAGVAALGYPLQMIAYKVLDNTGSGGDSAVANAIMAAANAGAAVISLSLGGAGYSQTLQTAVNYAWQRNSLVVVAAGNSGSNTLIFPGGANYAVGVAATDSSNAHASFSTFGNAVDIAAPGVGILSTLPTYSNAFGALSYGNLSGTSMATPHVSALAGLLVMSTPGVSAAAVLQRIQRTAASNIPNGAWDQNIGYGVMNAYNALAGNFRPATMGSLVGQLTDSAGMPLNGAVTVNGQSLSVDTTGLYRFPTLPAGTYSVNATSAGYAAQNLSATIVSGADTTLTIMMGVSYGKFTGTVTDPSVAVPGAIVQAIAGGLIAGTAVSDLNGQYALWVPGGTYMLKTSVVSGAGASAGGAVVASGGVTTVNLTLPAMGAVSGVVRDSSAQPVANALISVQNSSASAGAITDLNGNFRTAGLPAGSYTVTCSAAGFPDSTVNNVTVAPGNSTVTNCVMTNGAPGWYANGGAWNFRKRITVDHTKVSGASNLVSFPMLYSVTDPDLRTAANGGGMGKSNGTDLLFTAADGLTKLNHQIETYNASTGQLVAWVQIPSLSPSVDTALYLYYGNAGAADQQNSAAVWDTNYKAVWHMSETGGTMLNDATTYARNATKRGANNPAAVAGRIGGAQSFLGTGNSTANDYAIFAPTAATNTYSVEFWLNQASSINADVVVMQNNTGDTAGQDIWSSVYFNWYPTNTLYVRRHYNWLAGPAVSLGTWRHIAVTRNADTISIYLDGVLVAGSTGNGTAPENFGQMGFQGANTGMNSLNGILDELRISDTARSADWILTSYRNQNQPGAFSTAAGVEASGGASQVAAPIFNPPAGTFTSVQSVAITTTTAGATIRYTTDGSTPSETVGTIYSTGVPVNSSTTLKAVAYAAGMTDSTVTNGLYTINLPQVAAPAFNPPAGTYSAAQSVSITTTTAGATIRYTTDGSTPTGTVGTIYTTAVPVNSTTTLKAVAYAAGMTGSTVTAALYTISAGGGPSWYNNAWGNRKKITIDHTKVSGPVNLVNFPVLYSVIDANLRTAPNGGSMGKSDGTDLLFTTADGVSKLNHQIESYNAATGQLVAWVQVPSLSPGADTALYIYYGNAAATDQQNRPGVWDANYKAVWHMAETTGTVLSDSTSNARNATKRGVSNPAAVTGRIGGGQSFIGTGNSAANDFATFAETASTNTYTVEFWVNQASSINTDIVVMQNNTGDVAGQDIWSSVYFNWYPSNALYVRRHYDWLAGPVVGAGVWHHVAVTRNADTITVYLDGVLAATSTGNGTAGEGFGQMGFQGANTGMNSLNGILDELRISDSARSPDWIGTSYRNQNQPGTFYSTGAAETSGGATQVAAPSFNPPAGTYTSVQPVSITTTTSGATIRYTTDGSTPSETVGTIYTTTVPVNSSVTLKAIAYATGMADSTVTTGLYTISLPQVAAPAFSPPAGTYSAAQSVSITTATAGATIRYTTDGSIPSETTGAIYTTAVPVNSSVTLKAIAYASGMIDSAVSSGLYTISGGGGPAWYNNAWGNRKQITVDHTKVSGAGNLSNFPMLYSVADPNLRTVPNGGSMGKPDGTDLLFTAADGITKLNHQLESYSPTTGQLAAWVQIPTLSPSADTVLYVYYGNPGATDQQNRTGVWDTNYKGVWHMAESGGTVLNDSTANARNATKGGASNPAAVTGRIGGGQSFIGTGNSTANDYATFAPTTPTNTYTVEFWVNQASSINTDIVVMQNNTGDVAGQDIWSSVYFNWYPTNTLYIRRHYDWLVGPAVTTGIWRHIAVTRNGGTISAYVDGVLAASSSGNGTALENFGQIGFQGANTGINSLNGILDELRISDTARGPDWIGTEYRNQNAPAAFYSVGPNQTGP